MSVLLQPPLVKSAASVGLCCSSGIYELQPPPGPHQQAPDACWDISLLLEAPNL